MDVPTKSIEGYRRLIDIARDLASTLDLDILLNRIVSVAADLTDAEAASILLYDDASQQLYFQVATNLEKPTMRGLVVPLDGSIAGWIVRNRQSVRISNVHDDPRFFSDVEQNTQFATHSLLGIPLITKEKIIGVLEAINKKHGEFDASDEDLISVLGAQAAVAIENARLFQQSDLIAEFVHELRTPLASLGTATYLLLRPEISQEQREQIIHNIHNETLRLSALASSFLDLARLESGRVQFQLSEFEIKPLLEECRDVMKSQAEEKHVRVQIEAPDDLPLLEADRDKLKQVILNLLSNAIKYNRTNGSVVLKACTKEDWMEIAVQDTGVGIPENALPHLFEKFYRVQSTEKKAIGTGLGLSICKQIVQGHGGSIKAHSKSGVGTVFTVRLPLKAKRQ